MLKADLHIHTSEDPKENLAYDARELIDYAKNLGFDVIAITLHEKLFQNRQVFDYAKKKGILLIPGIELRIQGMDVLAYNDLLIHSWYLEFGRFVSNLLPDSSV